MIDRCHQNQIIFLLGLSCLSLLLACKPSPNDKDEGLPNIIVILADDMGFSDLGCYGSEISTPNLDRLAKNGLRYTRFYNAARCCPTRATLLTGLYPHQVGMGSMVVTSGARREAGPYQGVLREDSCMTVAELLKGQGYRSYMSGKWHVGEYPEYWPKQRGFDSYWGLISGASSYYEVITDQPRDRVMVMEDARWTPPDSGFYMTDFTAEYALDQIKQHQANHADQPFFQYIAFTAPHWPLHALPEDIAKYDGRYDIGWDRLRVERYQRMQAMGLFETMPVIAPRPETIPPWESIQDPEQWADRMEVYAAMVDRMDQGIGQLIKHLEETNALDNTLIMFLSDNGGSPENIEGRELHDFSKKVGEQGSYLAYQEPWAFASNTPFRYYKAWTHEGGSSTPLIMHWPQAGWAEGSIVRQPGHIIDVMSTIRDLTGSSYNPDALPLAGINLLDHIDSTDYTPRTLFWEHFNKKAVLDGDWKLVDGGDDIWELYDLRSDPSELQDLSAKLPDRVQAMAAQYAEWADEVGVE